MTAYKRESHIRSLLKGISWRVIATSDTILLVLLITCLTGNCSIENAIKIGFIEFVIKLLAYYLHERIWQKILIDKKVTKKKNSSKINFLAYHCHCNDIFNFGFSTKRL